MVVLGADRPQERGQGRRHDPDPRGGLPGRRHPRPTLTLPDSQAFMPLRIAQVLYLKDLPPDIADNLVASQTITHIVVYPKAGADVPKLAAAIEASLPNVTTVTASEFDESVGSMANLLGGIIVGVGLISLIVGGLSVVNTMAMSVNERTR